MNVRKSKYRHEAEISTDSMSDIMFFLMLFFLIVSTMVSPSVVKLTLPSARDSKIVPPKKPVQLEVSAEQQYFLAGKEVAFEDLETAMASAVAGMEQPTIVLRLDKALTIQQLVDVLEIGNRLKVKMILATEPTNG